MKVHLFHGPPQDRWFSMDLYASALSAALRAHFPELDVRHVSFPRPLPTVGGRMGCYLSLGWRVLPYPLLAAARRGGLNHILDHSYAHLAYTLPRNRTIVTCHDLAPWALAESRLSLSYAAWRWTIGGLKRAARVLADSQNTANDLQRFLQIPQECLRVVPLGVEPRFRPTPSDLQERLGLPDGKLVLHIGANVPRKNIQVIVEALNRLPEDVFLIQAGSNLATTARVRALGYVPTADLPALYSLADVFVFPSRYEGFGLPILEAMACCTPVIAANTSSLPEVVDDAGLLVSPDDPQELAAAIRRVLAEPDLAATLRERGLARARQFTWERTARQTLAVYREVWAEAGDH